VNGQPGYSISKLADSGAAQFGADQPVEADPFLGRLHGQFSMDRRRHSHDELSAEGSSGQRSRGDFSVLFHIGGDIFDDVANPPQRVLGASGKATKAREFSAKPDVFPVFLGPNYAIAIAVIFQAHFFLQFLSGREHLHHPIGLGRSLVLLDIEPQVISPGRLIDFLDFVNLIHGYDIKIDTIVNMINTDGQPCQI
jgi:hypothetical protein